MRALQIHRSAKPPASPHEPADREPDGWGSARLRDAPPRAARKFALPPENLRATTFRAGSAGFGRSGKPPTRYSWIYFRCSALRKFSWPHLIWHHVTTGSLLHAKCSRISAGIIEGPPSAGSRPIMVSPHMKKLYLVVTAC